MDKKLVKKFASYEKERIKKQMEREEFQARCDHKLEKKGRVQAQLKEVHGEDYAVCKICGAHVDFNPISQKEIAEASITLERALQQFKIIRDDVPGKVLDDIAFAIQVADRLENLYAPIRKELSFKNDGYATGEEMDKGNYYASSNYPLFESGKHHKKHHNHKGKDKDKDKKKHKHSSDFLYR